MEVVRLMLGQGRSGGLLARHLQAQPSQLGLSDASTAVPCAVCTAHQYDCTVLWPCNSACSLGTSISFYWLVSHRAFVASQARGFELRDLFLPLASFFPKLYCCPSCVASHIQPKGQVLLLDRALLLLNSQWPLLVPASISAHSHLSILQSSHPTLSTFPRVTAHFLFLPCTSYRLTLQELTFRVAESFDRQPCLILNLQLLMLHRTYMQR